MSVRKTNKDAFFGFGHLSFQINVFRCFWADGLASPRFVEKQLVDHFNGLIFLPWKKKKFALTTVLSALLNKVADSTIYLVISYQEWLT